MECFSISDLLNYPSRHPLTEIDFPMTLPAIQNLGKLELHPNVSFIVGENGTGKSTLLEAIAISYGI